MPELFHEIGPFRRAIAEAREKGLRIGLVPTMGALHQGHLSLVRRAKEECGFAAATIFVNPTQFGPKEDFSKYPRTLDGDISLLASCNADAVFVPAAETMYGAGFSTYVEPPEESRSWEGAFRPGHFRGVTTVVLKLFQISGADVAYFGQKDYQQATVVRRMIADFNLPIELRVEPTVREPDGLAMSSRNRYLSVAERSRALVVWRALQEAKVQIEAGEINSAVIVEAMRKILLEGADRIDYASLADPQSLIEKNHVDGPVVALIAVHVGSTRLIDNAILVPPR